MMTKVLNLYLKEIKHNDVEKNRSVLNTFIQTFLDIQSKLEEDKLTTHGMYSFPLHRSFAFYFSRLMLHNFMDPEVYPDLKKSLSFE